MWGRVGQVRAEDDTNGWNQWVQPMDMAKLTPTVDG